MFTLRAGVVSSDPSWENIGAAIWSSIELNVSIIASALPTLRPLIARVFPGIGLSSARAERTTYMRYGSESAAIRAGAFNKSVDSRKHHKTTQSISTEELALQDVVGGGGSPTGSTTAAYMYAHATAEAGKGYGRHGGGELKDDGHIVMTTEISVNTRAR